MHPGKPSGSKNKEKLYRLLQDMRALTEEIDEKNGEIVFKLCDQMKEPKIQGALEHIGGAIANLDHCLA